MIGAKERVLLERVAVALEQIVIELGHICIGINGDRFNPGSSDGQSEVESLEEWSE